MSDDAGIAIPKWFWWLGAGLAASVVVLMVLWYLRHPDRSPFVDFAPRRMGVPAANGATPHVAAPVGADAHLGPQEGEEV